MYRWRVSIPLVFDDLPGEDVAAMGITRPARPEAEIVDVDNPMEAVVPTGVS